MSWASAAVPAASRPCSLASLCSSLVLWNARTQVFLTVCRPIYSSAVWSPLGSERGESRGFVRPGVQRGASSKPAVCAVSARRARPYPAAWRAKRSFCIISFDFRLISMAEASLQMKIQSVRTLTSPPQKY